MVITVPLSTAVEPSMASYACIPLFDPPFWATHVFRGVIGQTDASGQPLDPDRYIGGYCSTSFKGRFYGGIMEPGASEPRGVLAGGIRGSVLVGIMAGRQGRIPLVGIGGSNETHFYFRMISLRGPSLYIAGLYEPIQ